MIRKLAKRCIQHQLTSEEHWNNQFDLVSLLVFRNFLSQLEDERTETESRLEKMSRDMEAVYQSKVTEKLQKLEESKQNVRKPVLI